MGRKMGWFARDVIAPALGRKWAQAADQVWDTLPHAGGTGPVLADPDPLRDVLKQVLTCGMAQHRTSRR